MDIQSIVSNMLLWCNISHAVQHWTAPHWATACCKRINVSWGLGKFDHLKVLSQLPLTRRLICGIQASSLIGASCPVKAVGCPPDSNGHILTTLSQPPEKTVVPSSFHAEHRTYTKYHQTVVVKHCRQGEHDWCSSSFREGQHWRSLLN
jgi:hypothetical protein